MLFKKKNDSSNAKSNIEVDFEHQYVIEHVLYSKPGVMMDSSTYPSTDDEAYNAEVRTLVEAIGSLDLSEVDLDSILNGIRLRCEHRLYILKEIHEDHVKSNVMNRAEGQMQLGLLRSELRRASAKLDKIRSQRDSLLRARKNMPSMIEIITGNRRKVSD